MISPGQSAVRSPNTRLPVDELFGDVQEIEIRALFGGSITPVLRVGEEYGVFRGTTSARDDEGNLLIDPSNGQIITFNRGK
jgi:hypothetical protein